MPEPAAPESVWSPRRVLLVAALYGMVEAFDAAVRARAATRLPLPAVGAFVLAGGPLLGLAYLYLAALLVSLAGRWLGGAPTRASLRAALAEAIVPLLAVRAVGVAAQLALVGPRVLEGHGPGLGDVGRVFVAAFLGVLQVAATLWALVRIVRGVSLASGLGVGRALAALLIAFLMALVPLVVLGMALAMVIALGAGHFAG